MIRVETFRQTIFVDHQNRNYAWLDVEGWDRCNPYAVDVLIDGQLVAQVPAIFHHHAELYLPRVDQLTDCVIRLRPFEASPVYYNTTLRPVTDLTVNFFSSSHEDLGYCGYVSKLESENADYLDAAMDLCDKDPRFHYMIEHTTWLRGFEHYRSGDARQRLQTYLDDGRIQISAGHSGVHTHWQGYEQLLRSTSFGTIHAAKTWNTQPKAVIHADVSGLTWAAVSAYAQMGIRYVGLYPNDSFRVSRDGTPLPRVFYWLAPNGKDKVLFHYQTAYRDWALGAIFQDCSRHGGFPLDNTRLTKVIDAMDRIVDQMGDVPYDMVPVCYYDDREHPSTKLLDLCDALSAKWSVPRFTMSTLEKTLSHLEANFSDSIPVLTGELNEQWADFATIAPQWTARKRQAERWFRAAEAVSAARSIQNGVPYPDQTLNQIQWRMAEFDEHCWATSSKDPQEMHRYNLRVTKEQSAKYADSSVQRLLTQGLGQCEATPILWNPLPFPTDHYADLPLGDEIQRFGDGTFLSRVKSLPAFGARQLPETVPAESTILSDDVTELETKYYRITLDPGSRQVAQIYDKTLQKNLLDPWARFPLGQYLYTNTESKLDSDISFEVPGAAQVTVEDGPLAIRLVRTSYEEQSCANVRTEIRFLHDDPTIDIRISFRNASGMMGDYYDRYKKNIFFSFPLQVRNHHFCTELAGCVADSRTSLEFNPRDFVVAQDWVAAENEDYGIAVLSQDMPVFHLGGIHYNKLSSRIYLTKSSEIYVYAASNRCNQLNFSDPESCSGDYRICLLPYAGRCQDVLPRWSQLQTQPPIAVGPEALTLPALQVEDPLTRLLTLKKAEYADDVFVLRLLNQSAHAKTVEVTLPAPICWAEYGNGLEQSSGKAASFCGCKLQVAMDGSSYATVLLRFEGVGAIASAPMEEGRIRNVFAFTIRNTGSLVAFEVTPDCTAREFRIYGDGQLLATVPNNGLRLQHVPLELPLLNSYTVTEA